MAVPLWQQRLENARLRYPELAKKHVRTKDKEEVAFDYLAFAEDVRKKNKASPELFYGELSKPEPEKSIAETAALAVGRPLLGAIKGLVPKAENILAGDELKRADAKAAALQEKQLAQEEAATGLDRTAVLNQRTAADEDARYESLKKRDPEAAARFKASIDAQRANTAAAIAARNPGNRSWTDELSNAYLDAQTGTAALLAEDNLKKARYAASLADKPTARRVAEMSGLLEPDVSAEEYMRRAQAAEDTQVEKRKAATDLPQPNADAGVFEQIGRAVVRSSPSIAASIGTAVLSGGAGPVIASAVGGAAGGASQYGQNVSENMATMTPAEARRVAANQTAASTVLGAVGNAVPFGRVGSAAVGGGTNVIDYAQTELQANRELTAEGALTSSAIGAISGAAMPNKAPTKAPVKPPAAEPVNVTPVVTGDSAVDSGAAMAADAINSASRKVTLTEKLQQTSTDGGVAPAPQPVPVSVKPRLRLNTDGTLQPVAPTPADVPAVDTSTVVQPPRSAAAIADPVAVKAVEAAQKAEAKEAKRAQKKAAADAAKVESARFSEEYKAVRTERPELTDKNDIAVEVRRRLDAKYPPAQDAAVASDAGATANVNSGTSNAAVSGANAVSDGVPATRVATAPKMTPVPSKSVVEAAPAVSAAAPQERLSVATADVPSKLQQIDAEEPEFRFDAGNTATPATTKRQAFSNEDEFIADASSGLFNKEARQFKKMVSEGKAVVFHGMDGLRKIDPVLAERVSAAVLEQTGRANAEPAAWVTRDGRLYINSARVYNGNAKAVIVHEVGSHLGVDVKGLTDDYADAISALAGRGNKIAQDALDSAKDAYKNVSPEKLRSESVAVFLQNAYEKLRTGAPLGRAGALYREIMGRLRLMYADAMKKFFGKDVTLTDNDILTAARIGRSLPSTKAKAKSAAKSDASLKFDIKDKDVDPQTLTAAFKRWFGDSKVVDADGRPMVMYHGTNKTEDGDAFTWFDTYSSNYGLFGQGAYFTGDPSVASEYTAKGSGESPTVYPVYLSIKNPIDMDAQADPAAWREAFEAVNVYPESFHEGGTTNESWYRAAEEAVSYEGMSKWEGAETIQDRLRSMGYDGITHIGGGRVKSEGKRHRVFIAFEPEQIKSAIGNTGAFDPQNSDIRFSIGDEDASSKSVPTKARPTLTSKMSIKSSSAAAKSGKNVESAVVRTVANLETLETGSAVAAALRAAAKDEDFATVMGVVEARLKSTGDVRVVYSPSRTTFGEFGATVTTNGGETRYIPTSTSVTISPRWASTVASEEIAAHELVHAASSLELLNRPDLHKKLVDLGSLAMAQYPAMKDVVLSSGNTVGDAVGRSSSSLNPKEFLAYGLTDPEFQKALKKVSGVPEQMEDIEASIRRRYSVDQPVRELSGWQKFVDLIRSLIGLDKKNQKALEKIIDLDKKTAADIERKIQNSITNETAYGRLRMIFSGLPDKRVNEATGAVSSSRNLTDAMKKERPPSPSNKPTLTSKLKATGNKLVSGRLSKNAPMRLTQRLVREFKGDAVPEGKGDSAVYEGAVGVQNTRAAAGVIEKRLAQVLQRAAKEEKVDVVRLRAALEKGSEGLPPKSKAAVDAVIRQNRANAAELVSQFNAMLENGWVSEASADVRRTEAIAANAGTYIRRTYDFFKSPALRKRFLAEDARNAAARGELSIIDRARTGHRRTMTIPDGELSAKDRDYYADLWGADSKANAAEKQAVIDRVRGYSQQQFDEAIEGHFEMLMTPPQRFAGKEQNLTATARNMSALMEREQVPDWLRELWGEQKDPYVNIIDSLSSQAELIAKNRFYMSLLNDSELVRTEAKAGYERIDNPALGPLHNKYMRPENMDILNNMAQGQAQGLMAVGVISKMLAAAKMLTVVYNLSSAVASAASNVFLVAMNGRGVIGKGAVSDIGKAAHSSLSAAFDRNLAKQSPEAVRTLVEAYKYGIYGDTVLNKEVAEDIKTWSRSGIQTDAQVAGLLRIINPIKAGGQGLAKFFSGTFTMSDAMPRVYVWLRNIELYKKAHPEWSIDKVKEAAADLTTKGMISFSRQPRLIKAINQRSPLTPFLTNTMEMVRASFYHLYKGASHIASGNKVLMQDGVVRLSAALAVLGSPAVITALNGDAEREKDFQETLPPYAKGVGVIDAGVDDYGMTEYYDTRRLNPFSPTASFLSELAMGNLEGAGDSLLRNISGTTPGAIEMAKVIGGVLEKAAGRQSAAGEAQMDKDVMRLLEVYTPATPRKIVQAVIGANDADAGNKQQREGTFDVGDFALSLVGMSPAAINTVDGPMSAIAFAHRDFEDTRSAAITKLKDQLASRDYQMSQEQVTLLVTEALQRDADAFKEYKAVFDAVRRRNELSDDEIAAKLKVAAPNVRKAFIGTKRKPGMLFTGYDPKALASALKEDLFEKVKERQTSTIIGQERRTRLEDTKYTDEYKRMVENAIDDSLNNLEGDED